MRNNSVKMRNNVKLLWYYSETVWFMPWKCWMISELKLNDCLKIDGRKIDVLLLGVRNAYHLLSLSLRVEDDVFYQIWAQNSRFLRKGRILMMRFRREYYSPCLVSTKSNKTPKFPKKYCFHLTGSVRTVKKPPRWITSIDKKSEKIHIFLFFTCIYSLMMLL